MSKKRKKRSKRVVINARDRELFNYLYEVKVATQKQLGRDVYRDVSKTVVYRRLKKLISMKYIKRSLFFNGKRAISAYSLSKTGLRKFIFSGENDKYVIKRCLSDSIDHDMILNDIRHQLLKYDQVLEYYSENVLLSNASIVEGKEFEAFKDKHSDGMIFFKKNDNIFHMAVEYEHTVKYNSRYRDLFFRYQLESEIACVLCICANKKILNQAASAEKKNSAHGKRKGYYALAEDVLKDTDELEFVSGSGEKVVTLSKSDPDPQSVTEEHPGK